VAVGSLHGLFWCWRSLACVGGFHMYQPLMQCAALFSLAAVSAAVVQRLGMEWGTAILVLAAYSCGFRGVLANARGGNLMGTCQVRLRILFMHVCTTSYWCCCSFIALVCVHRIVLAGAAKARGHQALTLIRVCCVIVSCILLLLPCSWQRVSCACWQGRQPSWGQLYGRMIQILRVVCE
jgi:hypothetical protein